jgi:hypothetical protein
MDWATLWATFSRAHRVAPLKGSKKSNSDVQTQVMMNGGGGGVETSKQNFQPQFDHFFLHPGTILRISLQHNLLANQKRVKLIVSYCFT